MNLAYFHLRSRPFRSTPDTQFYYPSTTHESAIRRIAEAIADDEGIVLLTGTPGTGKTLVGQLLLERHAGVSAALLTNCRFATRGELLRAILFDLAQPHQGLSEQELRFQLTEYLLDNHANGRTTLLILDEAQDLTVDALEELRLLSNLENRRGKAAHMVLIGQPGLLETIRRPELAVLNQRAAVQLRLEPLPLPEAVHYLLHQVGVAGGRPNQLFTDEAAALIAEHTGGVPRLLNQAAAHCLALAESVEAESVDAEVALETLASIGLAHEDTAEEADPASALRATDEGLDEPPAAPPRIGRAPSWHPGLELGDALSEFAPKLPAGGLRQESLG